MTARVFSQRFYCMMKPFFLKSLEQLDTDSLFATISLFYSLFGVACTKGVETEHKLGKVHGNVVYQLNSLMETK